HTRSKRDWSSDVCSSDLTAKVKEQKSDEKFQKMVNDYIQTDQRLSDYYQDTKIEFSPVKYNEEIKDTEKRSLDIYSQMSKVLLQIGRASCREREYNTEVK